MCPPAVAEAFVNLTLPKSESVTVRQAPSAEHSDGASATHSADEVSGAAMRLTFVTDLPVVTSVTCIVTFVPATVTVAVIVSPGSIVSGIVMLGAGTSSYQAE